MQLLLPILGILLGRLLLQKPAPDQPRPVVYRHLPVYRKVDAARFFTDEFQLTLIATKPEGLKVLMKSAKGKEQPFSEPTVSIENCPDIAFSADLNGDGRLDLKLLFNFQGASPLASKVKRKMYLLSRPDGSFSKLSFFDFSQEPETDFNGDNQYEIVAKDLIQFKKHSYWKYELYQFSGDKLINVSLRYNYPKLVPYRIKRTSRSPASLAEADRCQLMSKQPREYDQQ
jgi:hypothetical protein